MLPAAITVLILLAVLVVLVVWVYTRFGAVDEALADLWTESRERSDAIVAVRAELSAVRADVAGMRAAVGARKAAP